MQLAIFDLRHIWGWFTSIVSTGWCRFCGADGESHWHEGECPEYDGAWE